MQDFLILIGQIFIIVWLQVFTEQFVKVSENKIQVGLLNIACFMGTLYLVLQFAEKYLFSQVAKLVNFTF